MSSSAKVARSAALAVVFALAVALPVSARAAAPVPALSGPVVDEAGVLDARGRSALDALCRAAWEQPHERRVQLQYLLVRSLQGEDLEGYAVRVFEAWKLGDRDRDNGVLVVVAVEDRRVRIETGYGTEGGLTDAQSGRIIRQVIAPAFRQGAYAEGLHEAGVQILGALGALPQNVRPRQGRPGAVPPIGASALIVLAIIFFVVRVLSSFGPRRRFTGRRGGWGMWGGPFGGMGGGGWGGGGFGGGGGWGGGGGRSGGGGASGGW